MEARSTLTALVLLAASLSLGASYRTENFLVTAATPELAREICEQAETFRRDLAVEWLGAELPRWSEPCPINAQVAQHLGAGGATSFMFRNHQPFGWTMTIQGSRERILDSVLPHEVTHTIFATHFGQPLPRWADEGACTTVEHASERAKQEQLLYQFLTTNRGIAFNQMFAMREYPADILPLYSQGYSLARYLIGQGGKQRFIDYVGEGLQTNNWTAATQRHYNYRSLAELQTTWLEWVRQGMPDLNRSPAAAAQDALVAENARPAGAEKLVAIPQENSPNGARRGLSVQPVSAETRQDSLAAAQADRVPSGAEYGRAGGWYARQRETSSTTIAAAPAGRATIRSAPAANATDDVSQYVTRPQQPQQAQQTILEWSRPPANVTPLPGGIAPAPAFPMQSAVNPSGTVLR